MKIWSTKKVSILSLAVFLASQLSLAKAPSPTAIFHAFDMQLCQLDEPYLERLSKLGFSHVQISPIQESASYIGWHAAYQPRSYEIGNTYGTEEDLKKLIGRAKRYGLGIIVDVVFNHLAGVSQRFRAVTEQNWKNAYESDPHLKMTYLNLLFKNYGELFEVDSAPSIESLFVPWNQDGWLGGALPQLNTEHPKVREAQLAYLEKLTRLGVKGIRLDAIQTISRDSLHAYQRAQWIYGEQVQALSESGSVPFPITDFVLLKSLIAAFSYGGSLAALRVPETNGASDAVTFAMNHDTWAASQTNGKKGIDLNFGDPKDRTLATLYVLARKQGVPLIFKDQIDESEVQAGIQFRAAMEKSGAPIEHIPHSEALCEGCSSRTLMFLARGDRGFLLVNKAGEDLKAHQLDLSSWNGLSEGCYEKIQSDQSNSRERLRVRHLPESGASFLEGVEQKLKVPARSGSFYLRVPCES